MSKEGRDRGSIVDRIWKGRKEGRKEDEEG